MRECASFCQCLFPFISTEPRLSFDDMYLERRSWIDLKSYSNGDFWMQKKTRGGLILWSSDVSLILFFFWENDWFYILW